MKAEIDLGEQSGETSVSPQPQESSKPRYPSFSVSGAPATSFEEQCDCDVGEEFTASCRLKKCGMSDDEYGKRVTFEVISMTPDEMGEEMEEPKEQEPAKVSRKLRGNIPMAAKLGRKE